MSTKDMTPEDRAEYEALMDKALAIYPRTDVVNAATEEIRIQAAAQLVIDEMWKRAKAGDPRAKRISHAMALDGIMAELDEEIAENGPIYSNQEAARRMRARVQRKIDRKFSA